MKLHLTPAEGLQLFSGYGAGYVAVNRVRYERSVLVSPQALAEIARAGVPELEDPDVAPFPFSHRPCAARTPRAAP